MDEEIPFYCKGALMNVHLQLRELIPILSCIYSIAATNPKPSKDIWAQEQLSLFLWYSPILLFVLPFWYYL